MSALKGSLCTILFFVVSEIVYKLYCRTRRHGIKSKNESKSEGVNSIMEALFFPDKKVACRDYFLTNEGCFKINCRFSHDQTSLSQLYRYMTSCQTSIDVCIYVFTCKDLADILIRLHRQQVKVRVITDKDQLCSSGSQIWNLIKEGIEVKVNENSSYLMHHKFVIVDEKILINGSFNWTYQAITGNEENLLITNDHWVTSAFKAEFQKLWNTYDKQMCADFQKGDNKKSEYSMAAASTSYLARK